MNNISQTEFERVFNAPFEHIYLAPARINLIGEHIDYNGGKVLPAAISLNVTAYVRKNNNKRINLYSTIYTDPVSFDLYDIEYKKEQDWANYPLGMFYILRKHGFVIDKGLDIYFISDIPPASGLSSSAAMLDLTGLILNEEFNLGISNKEIALLAKECENDFNGLACGIMDQAAIALGKKDHAILIDTSNFTYSYHPMLLNDYTFVVLSTNKHRLLTESKYNERVEECTKALNILKEHYDISNLCELKVEDLLDIEHYLNDELLFRRVRHLITENKRVSDFMINLKIGNVSELGNLLNASDKSLKEDYEVTGLHLDTITFAAKNHPSCLGARMTGAGFGGCGIALVKKDDFESFKAYVEKYYEDITNITPSILAIEIDDGIRKVL